VALAVPGPALVVLLALSVLHFAEGEAAVAPLLRPSGSTPGRRPRTDAAAWTAAAVALAVVAGPIARWPDDVARVVRPLSPGLASILGDGPVRLLLAVAVLAVSAVAVALARGDGAGRADVAVVVAAVAVVPPLALFAVWFACWHSARHLVRLAAQRPLRPLLLRAVAPSAAAAAVAVALTPLLGGAPAVLVVLLALTVPHAVVVATALRPGPPRRAAAARSPSGRQVAEHVLPREHADRAPVRDDDGGVGLLQR
jgi:Brp/Blh family beta-carotene 15,15'-monooxygenase